MSGSDRLLSPRMQGRTDRTDPLTGPGLDLHATAPPLAPALARAKTVMAFKAPHHVKAWVQAEAAVHGVTPSTFLAQLVRNARDGALPDDVTEWLLIQAQQCGTPGDPTATLIAIVRHLADRWPQGARLQ